MCFTVRAHVKDVGAAGYRVGIITVRFSFARKFGDCRRAWQSCPLIYCCLIARYITGGRIVFTSRRFGSGRIFFYSARFQIPYCRFCPYAGPRCSLPNSRLLRCGLLSLYSRFCSCDENSTCILVIESRRQKSPPFVIYFNELVCKFRIHYSM